DPNKVELHSGAKAYALVRNGADWWVNGKKMDLDSVESVVSKLRELSATKFTDSGFTTSAIDVTVTSNDGKQTEKVLIAKAGNRYIAKRDNESALYELDPTVVDSLLKAGDELKPATSPAK